MIIDIKKLKEGVSYFDIEETAEKLDIDIEDGKILGLVKCTVMVDNEIERFTVKGKVKASLQTVCSRCGVDFKRNINEDFEHKYIKGQFAEEGELNKDALDEELLTGDELNLGEDVRQAVLLAVAELPVCTDKCKGICAGCGKNLNKVKCSCKKGESKPFADLKKLLKEKKK